MAPTNPPLGRIRHGDHVTRLAGLSAGSHTMEGLGGESRRVDVIHQEVQPHTAEPLEPATAAQTPVVWPGSPRVLDVRRYRVWTADGENPRFWYAPNIQTAIEQDVDAFPDDVITLVDEVPEPREYEGWQVTTFTVYGIDADPSEPPLVVVTSESYRTGNDGDYSELLYAAKSVVDHCDRDWLRRWR